MGRILMVSKPVVAPWNDSSKNLVRDLACHMRRHQPVVLTRRAAPALPGVAAEALYAAASREDAPTRFAPAFSENARVLSRLLIGPRHDLWHFFFAPNPRSSRLCALASHARSVPSVQTVCSAPLRSVDPNTLLFADRTVVLSRHTEQAFLEAGVPRETLRRIPPCAEPLPLPDAAGRAGGRAELGLPADAALIVYPGDLEFSAGAERSLRAFAALDAKSDALLIVASRAKTQRARDKENALRALAGRLGVAGRVRYLGETPRIHAVLAAADVIVLPSETLYAKMDLPMALIEAMFLERAVVVAEGTPAAELSEGGGALALEASEEALAACLSELLADGEQRRALGARAREVALERYHPAAMASAYEALYDELLRS